MLERGGWDGIVFDGISTGWALPGVLDHYGTRRDRPRLIYISHNHEESLRAQIAESQPLFLKRQAVRLDAFKVSRLDGRAVTVTPEFDEVKRVARDKGVAVRDALEQARAEGRRLVG